MDRGARSYARARVRIVGAVLVAAGLASGLGAISVARTGGLRDDLWIVLALASVAHLGSGLVLSGAEWGSRWHELARAIGVMSLISQLLVVLAGGFLRLYVHAFGGGLGPARGSEVFNGERLVVGVAVMVLLASACALAIYDVAQDHRG